MASVNKVILVGYLGADPETRGLPDGGTVTTIRLATSDRYKDKAGNKQERTEWHRVVFFGNLAKLVAEHCKKRHPLYVEGSLRTREWEKDGVKRYTTEIVAGEMQFLKERERSSQAQGEDDGSGGAGRPFAGLDDDLPY